MPALSSLVTPSGGHGAEMVLLVKPQFEVGREDASRGRGVITDPLLHRASVDKVSAAAVASGWTVAGETVSPLKGQDGNTEFLLHLRDPARS
jgi:23S rRNA (cytidine1920-2'-O)/16S rRNA (cytidine1409-2'-O)-methyltransferase